MKNDLNNIDILSFLNSKHFIVNNLHKPLINKDIESYSENDVDLKTMDVFKHGPKVKKLINVKQHIREGEMVHQFKRQQLVEEKQPVIQEQSIESVLNILSEANHEFEAKNYEEQQPKLLEAYRGPEHAIWDQGFEKDDKFLYELFNNTYNLFSMFNVDAHDANDNLTSSNFINSLHQNSKKLEIHLNKIGYETKRLSPFTFKISHQEENPNISDLISQSLRTTTTRGDYPWQNFVEKIENNLKLTVQTAYGSNSYSDNVSHGNQQLSKVLNNLIIGTDLNENTIRDRIISPLIATNVLSPTHYKEIAIDQKKNAFDYFLIDHIQENMPDDLKNFDALIKDPELIRKALKDTINNAQLFTKDKPVQVEQDRKKLLKSIKEMKVSDIPIHFVYLMEHARLFPYIDNKIVMKSINNISDTATKIAFDRYNDMGDIYFSNNPFEKLTMSQQGIITSCQSISRDGRLSIDSNNANIISAINNPSDFILFTKQGNTHFKRERISLNYDDGKLYNFENIRIYSSERDKNIVGALKKQIESNPKIKKLIEPVSGYEIAYDNLEESIKEQANVEYIFDSCYRLMDDAHSYFGEKEEEFKKQVTSQSEQDDMKKEIEGKQNDEYINDFDGYKNELFDFFAYNDSREIINDALNDAYEKTTKNSNSFLYGSPSHFHEHLVDTEDDEIYRHIISDVKNRINLSFNTISNEQNEVRKKYSNTMDNFSRLANKMPKEPID